MLGKVQALDELRRRLAALEAPPVLREADAQSGPRGPLTTPRGVLHEVFADGPADAGAALGFALAQAKGQIGPGRPGLAVLQLRADAQELGLPYGLGLESFGLAAEAVVLVRAGNMVELLWALEEAVACRAMGAVVADIAYAHKALDFTASRRLALRSAAAGGAAFLVRYARSREASAARYRWRVLPAPSAPPPFDARAPGPPRWRVVLEKGSLDPRRRGSEGEAYLVDWTEHGLALADDIGRDRPPGRQRPAGPAVAPLSGADPAALGDRLSQAG